MPNNPSISKAFSDTKAGKHVDEAQHAIELITESLLRHIQSRNNLVLEMTRYASELSRIWAYLPYQEMLADIEMELQVAYQTFSRELIQAVIKRSVQYA